MKPTRPELPREYVAVHKRRRMIAAVVELTAARGYDATQIADIVRVARVARKTLYDNFDGKEDLFLAAFDLSVKELTEAVEAACAEEDDWPARIEAGLAAFLGYVADNPATARMCMIEALSATPSASARYDDALRRFVDLLEACAPPEADLPPTVEETLVGGVAWIVHQRIRRGEAERATELIPELSEFVLSPYHGVTNSLHSAGKRK